MYNEKIRLLYYHCDLAKANSAKISIQPKPNQAQTQPGLKLIQPDAQSQSGPKPTWQKANQSKSQHGKKPTQKKNNPVKSSGKANQAYSQPSPKPIWPKCKPAKANPA